MLVILKAPGIGQGSYLPKSADTWAGPFRIRKRFKSGSYQLVELDGTKLTGSIPVGHLKPFYTRGSQELPEQDATDEEDDSDGMYQFNLESSDKNKRDENYEESG